MEVNGLSKLETTTKEFKKQIGQNGHYKKVHERK